VSMTVSLKTVSLDRYKANLDKITLIVGKAAADVESNAKTSILESSGNYRKYGNHYSSPPGTPPNSDTGFLANSIMHRMTNRTSAEVATHAKYAVPLELGWTSKGGNSVPARPFMEPALYSVRPQFERAIKAVLRGK
jgi:phage gpG-like protein